MSQMRRAIREIWRAAQASPAARSTVIASCNRVPAGPPTLPLARFDDWSCLQDLDGAQARRLLKEEAVATQAFFADTGPFEAQLQAEAEHILLPQSQVPPEVCGDYLYFERYTTDGFVVFCRQLRSGGGAAEVLLDTSKIAQDAGTGYADVAACKVSDDHAVLAYVADTVGDESYELRLRALGGAGGEEEEGWPVRLPGVRSVEFLGGGDAEHGYGLLAVLADPRTKRACRVSYLHVTPQGIVDGGGGMLWDEADEAAYLEVFRTKDRGFLLLSSNTKDTSEVRVVRCHGNTSGSEPVPTVVPDTLLPPREGVEYFAEHQAGKFYIISNHERPDFAVYQLPASALGTEDACWSRLLPFYTPPGDLHVTDADLLEEWLVLYGHEAAGPRICVVPVELDNGWTSGSQGQPVVPAAGGSDAARRPYLVQLPLPVGSVEPGVNGEPGAGTVRFTFRSPLEPGSVYDLELATGATRLVDRRAWSPAVDVGQFECVRVEYPTRDGERVPLTLARPRPGAPGDSAVRPCLLHVYGAYGSCLTPGFRPEHVALLRRGWSVAWAHVRGGGERGRAWHAAARRLHKARSVCDLADAVRFLLARGIAAPGALCLKASSAGGLTLGALLNSPDEATLVAAAVLEVPFVDVLTGMLDPALPLTVHEFAEWGDPRDAVHAANLRSLSPYENVGSHDYPAMYLSCALADTRVPPWMPLKLAARIRARTRSYIEAPSSSARRRHRQQHTGTRAAALPPGPNVVLQCSDGGHSGTMDWQAHSEGFARQIAFLYKALQLELR